MASPGCRSTRPGRARSRGRSASGGRRRSHVLLPWQRLLGQRRVGQRATTGVDPAAARAGAGRRVVVEGGERLGQVVDQAGQLHLAAVDEAVAARAVPLEPVDLPGRPRTLDHQPDRAGHGALGRVPDVRRQEEDVAFADGDVAGATLLPHPQDHVAPELVEELVARVVVKVRPLVGPAPHGDDEVPLVPDLRVPDRRSELLAVFVDPAGEIDGPHADAPSGPWLRAMALISMARCGCGSWWTATVVRAGPVSAAKCSA